jgi:hypothetical protein
MLSAEDVEPALKITAIANINIAANITVSTINLGRSPAKDR